jgi:hypothetical protein
MILECILLAAANVKYGFHNFSESNINGKMYNSKHLAANTTGLAAIHMPSIAFVMVILKVFTVGSSCEMNACCINVLNHDKLFVCCNEMVLHKSKILT